MAWRGCGRSRGGRELRFNPRKISIRTRENLAGSRSPRRCASKFEHPPVGARSSAGGAGGGTGRVFPALKRRFTRLGWSDGVSITVTVGWRQPIATQAPLMVVVSLRSITWRSRLAALPSPTLQARSYEHNR